MTWSFEGSEAILTYLIFLHVPNIILKLWATISVEVLITTGTVIDEEWKSIGSRTFCEEERGMDVGHSGIVPFRDGVSPVKEAV